MMNVDIVDIDVVCLFREMTKHVNVHNVHVHHMGDMHWRQWKRLCGIEEVV
jgi:hypothetical protein